MKHLVLVLSLTMVGATSALARTETDESVSDKGYQFDDGGRKIKWAESDGPYTEIPYYREGIQTPCSGMTLPSNKTRNAVVQPALNCSGSLNINEKRQDEKFQKMSGFKEIAGSGDDWALFEFMRKNSKSAWNYKLDYTTNVNWTWTKNLKGKNGAVCGYRYEPETCTRTIEVRTRTCTYVPDPPSSSSGGSYGGSYGGGTSSGSSSSGSSRGSSSGGGYERSNPFRAPVKDLGQYIMDLLVPAAQAGEECGSWSSRDRYESFTCYRRYVKDCHWSEQTSESLTCSGETLPVTVNLVKKSDSTWNPRQKSYVPFLPNGYDLLPGETEWMRLNIRVSGGGVGNDQPHVVGGDKGDSSSYYSYRHEIRKDGFQCIQNAKNEFQWDLIANDRQVSKTPNSLAANFLSASERETQETDFNKTGLFSLTGENVFAGGGETPTVQSQPKVMKILDTSSQTLRAVTSAFRRNDRGAGKTQNRAGQTVSNGTASAGEGQGFWKDTFYRIQLYETFPGRSKKPIKVTDVLVQTDSLIERKGNLITIPLAGQDFDTNSAYDLSSSGVLIPKGYFRVMGGQYIMIPGQTYEMKVSMLHRGIPFYVSGCANEAVSCEREKPNDKAFSDEKSFTFVYSGSDERGAVRKYYDYWRRW